MKLAELQQETVLSEEMMDASRGFASGPERALMSALLFDGVQAYMSYRLGQQKDERNKEAVQWVHQSPDEYIFSFNNVCESLGIDPNYLRYGLLNAINSARQSWKRGRRNF